jgi:hypothetical protein
MIRVSFDVFSVEVQQEEEMSLAFFSVANNHFPNKP